MIYTALKDLYYVELFVLHWMICTTFMILRHWMICITLHDLPSVELFVQRWIIWCTALNYLYFVELICIRWWFDYVEWFVQRWMIFYFVAKFLPPRMTCTAKELCSIDRFVLRWMIQSAMGDLYNVESFGLRLIIDYRLFNECQVCLFKKML